MWKLRDPKVKSLEDYFQSKINIPLDEFLKGRNTDTYHIGNEDRFVELVNQYKKQGKHFHIIGDYDVDGITSTYIMKEGLEKFGVRVTYRIPHRFTEGYGINKKIIEEISDPENSVIVTVDNGISAMECMELLSEKEIPVLLTDHHLPVVENEEAILPKAEVIVNPHVTGGDFDGYCGAGVALKLMKKLNGSVTPEMKVAACIGTIADMMDLVEDNREIVKEGLHILNEHLYGLSAGFQALVSVASIQDIKVTDIAFNIAPMLNAPGRLYDCGAENSLLLLSHKGDLESAVRLAVHIKEDNDSRKESEKYVVNMLSESIDDVSAPLIVNIPDIGEGIIGLIAIKLCEKYNMPTIVFTNSGEGMLKGSGRAPKGFHMKHFLDQNSGYFEGYGGHEGAAGMEIKESNYEEMKKALKENINYTPDNVKYYDLEVMPDEALDVLHSLKKYEPLGKGFECPVFAAITDSDKYFLMGEGKQHIKVLYNGLNLLGFSKSKEIINLLGKRTIFIGKLTENTWQGHTTPQLVINSCENL